MSLDNMKQDLMAIVFIAVLVGAGAIALDGFQDQIQDSEACANVTMVFNDTTGACMPVNTTGGWTFGAQTYALNGQYNITQAGLEGTMSATDFLGTIGTLIGVSALIAVVIGAFYFVTR